MLGVKFGNMHSYDDFGLILNHKNVPLPKPRTNYITVEGSDGDIDLSTVLTDGQMKYDDRLLDFEFTVMEPYKNWDSIKSKLANYLHGRKMKIVLDSDPNYFYFGRCEINEFQEDRMLGKLVIQCKVEPYKYDKYDSRRNWKWDTFNFQTGNIHENSLIHVEGTKDVSVRVDMQLVPEFELTGEMDVDFEGTRYHLSSGKNKILNILFKVGVNQLKFLGTGDVSIIYRGGSL